MFLGKLNLHEGALGATTDNAHHGRTQNPWRLGHTPGGSSGGSGAAVAARLAAATLGSDTMGSVRLPAAYCGTVGLKPTYGAGGQAGVHLLCPELDQVGPLARSVADVALMHAGMTGTALVPDAVSLEGLKVGLVDAFDEVEIDPEIAAAFEAALASMTAQGATVARLAMSDYQPTLARRAGLLISEADAWQLHHAAMARAPDAYSQEFTAMLCYGRDADPARVAGAREAVHDFGWRFRALLGEVDVVAAPTAPQTAFAFEAPVPVSQADLSALANFAGAPALSLPMGLSSQGLPMGLQLIAAPAAEARLLAVAAAVEALLPPLPLPRDS